MFRSLLKVPYIGGFTSFGARYLSSINHTIRPIQFGQPSFIIPAFLQQPSTKIPSITTPPQPKGLIQEIEENVEENTLYSDSVKRKRKLKMKKHKLRKRRRAQRSLKKRLGK